MNNEDMNINNILDLQSSRNRINRPRYQSELNMLYHLFMNETYLDSNPNNVDENRVINDSFYQERPYKKVFDIENNNDLLKNTCYDKNKHKNASCPIYMVDFKDDDEIVELPCGHCFIPEAIYKWLENQSNCCPFCRYELPFKEIKKDQTNTPSGILYQHTPLNDFSSMSNGALLQILHEFIYGYDGDDTD